MDNRKKNHHPYTWKTIVAVLACVVAFSTVCKLTLPAIAMEKECGLEEHQHSEACYAQVTDNQQQDEAAILNGTETANEETAASSGDKVLICQIPEHIHTDACSKKQDALQSEPAEEPVAHSTAQQQASGSVDHQDDPKDTGETVDPAATEDQSTLTGAEASQNRQPIDVAPYVVSAKLQYKDKTDPVTGWQEIQQNVPIPGDAKLRLEVRYEHVPIQTLIDSGCQLSFQIPKVMRNPVAQGDIKDDHVTVGTITVTDDVLTMTFKQEWLDNLHTSGQGSLMGEFYVESDIRLSEITIGGGALDIVIGDVHITPTFDTDVVAKYGKLEVEKIVSKHVIEDHNVHCLEYELTVRAGEDGSPDVKVVDFFEINGQYVEYLNVATAPARLTGDGMPREEISPEREHGEIYKGAMPTASQPIPPENDVEITEPGSLVWKIGDMEPNEQRTLTYRVKLSRHNEHKDNDQPLRNKASVYSKTYKRNDAVADFTPKADLAMNKSHAAPKRNPADGSYKISYTVWFEAPNSNNHVLEGVRVTDSLKLTNGKALPYIRYDEDSFKLYPSKQAQGIPVELNKPDGTLPKLDFSEDRKGFTLSMGEIKAGTAYCLQYDLIVDAKAFGAANLDGLTVKNRVVATAENAHAPSKDFIREFHDNCDIGYKNWIRKAVAKPLSDALTVALPGENVNVYDATGGTIVPDAGKPESFMVPAGSYPYTITINDLGDWDVTEANIKDTLSKDYIQYVGYLRVDAYDAGVPGNDPLGIFVESHWVKIHELKSFQFRLSDIGFSNNSYAYRFTYYVSPIDIDSISQAVVNNTANISGPVSKDGETFQIGDFGSKVEITIQGGHSFEAKKDPWYYENPKVSTGTWSKGAIYWGIKLDGDELHKGSWIRDFVKTEHPHPNRAKIFFHNDSFVGIYKGKLPDGVRFNDYSDLQALAASGYVTQLPTDTYCNVFYEDKLNIRRDNTYSDVYIEIKENIPLDNGDSVFLILKSEPDTLPSGVRTQKDYTNYVGIGHSKESVRQCGLATKHLYGGQNILKEFTRFIRFDGKKITDLKNGKYGVIPQELLPEPGHYIAWASKINYGGDLSGRYRIVDEIPAGTEVAFVRQKWLGSSTRNQNIRMYPIENYKQVLGEDWTEHHVTAGMDQAEAPIDSYYYTNGHKVLWEVDNLIAGHERDNYAVDFQIVCRVTDPEVLQGGAKKEFVNQVFLQNTSGTQLDSSSSGVTISVNSLEKNAKVLENTVDFEIIVNIDGEDLIENAKTITLIDEMSESLKLDISSIQVVNLQTNRPTRFKASLDGQIMKIVVPDDRPLKITYTTHVNAAPDSYVTLANRAYWMGYSQKSGDNVVINDFHYEIGGTAGGIKSPQVKILKYDKNDVLKHLEGAQFQMEEGTMEQGVFKGNGNTWTGTTGSDGTLAFGAGLTAGKHMSYNTVYCVRETRAPEGYVLDEQPYYFIIAKKVGEKYPAYPDGVHVHYEDAVYPLEVPNGRGEAYVQKQFRGADGTAVNAIPGRYRFGLFDNAQGTGIPLQDITLNVTETGPVQQVTFTDLDLTKTYYVFELDEHSKPILPGELGYVNSTPFEVEYQSDGSGAVCEIRNGETVTITNKMCVESLPETGGIGTGPYLLAGLALMCGSMGAAYYQSRRRKYGK